jgi:hypothetical protein
VTIRLTKLHAEIVEHRLSAGTLGDLAQDTFVDADAEDAERRQRIEERVDAAAERMLFALPNVVLNDPIDAWCLANCVEWSTWDGIGMPYSPEWRKAGRQIESLRQRLNRDPGMVDLYGRHVQPHIITNENAAYEYPASEVVRAAFDAID